MTSLKKGGFGKYKLLLWEDDQIQNEVVYYAIVSFPVIYVVYVYPAMLN